MVKNNKLFKVLAVILTIVCVVSLAGVVNAEPTTTGGDAWPSGLTGSSSTLSGSLSGYGSILLGIFQVVGYIAAVVVLAWLGIKYLTAAPEGKAEIKKQAFAYLIGALLLFAAGTIVGWVKTAVDNGTTTTTTTGLIDTAIVEEYKA